MTNRAKFLPVRQSATGLGKDSESRLSARQEAQKNDAASTAATIQTTQPRHGSASPGRCEKLEPSPAATQSPTPAQPAFVNIVVKAEANPEPLDVSHRAGCQSIGAKGQRLKAGTRWARDHPLGGAVLFAERAVWLTRRMSRAGTGVQPGWPSVPQCRATMPPRTISSLAMLGNLIAFRGVEASSASNAESHAVSQIDPIKSPCAMPE